MNLSNELVEARADEREHRAALARIEADRLEAEYMAREEAATHDRLVIRLLERGTNGSSRRS